MRRFLLALALSAVAFSVFYFLIAWLMWVSILVGLAVGFALVYIKNIAEAIDVDGVDFSD